MSVRIRENSFWLFMIFTVLITILLYIIDINLDIEQQSLTEAQRIEQREQKAQKEQTQISEKAKMHTKNAELLEKNFAAVADDDKATWIKLKLDEKHPFAFIGLISLIAVILGYFAKSLLSKKE